VTLCGFGESTHSTVTSGSAAAAAGVARTPPGTGGGVGGPGAGTATTTGPALSFPVSFLPISLALLARGGGRCSPAPRPPPRVSKPRMPDTIKAESVSLVYRDVWTNSQGRGKTSLLVRVWAIREAECGGWEILAFPGFSTATQLCTEMLTPVRVAPQDLLRMPFLDALTYESRGATAFTTAL